MLTRHIPVMLEEVCDALKLEGETEKRRTLFDGTLGGGGHSEALLERNEKLFLVGMDRDETALARVRRRLERFADRMLLLHGNFADVAQSADAICRATGQEELKFDRMLLDLGISSDQLDDEARGFTFSGAGELDMRMDKSQSLTAAVVLNDYSERDLRRVFQRGDVGAASSRLAREVARARPIADVAKFRSICEKTSPRRGERKHPAMLPFMAVRIEVNRELDSVVRFVDQAPDFFAPGAVFAAISFHSLEDKFITRAMRRWTRPQVELHPLAASVVVGKLLTPHALTPSEDEGAQNSRSRSARLRVFRAAG